MRSTIAVLSLGLMIFGLTGCYAVPVAPPPPRPVVYAPVYAPGYYAEPVYPAYGYYGGPSVALNFGGRGYGGHWR